MNWIEELLSRDFIRKPMFGGFAYYFENRLVLVMFENPGDRSYRKIKYEYDLWNGCLFPAEREVHHEIFQKFSFLINHPILSKWLYLPLDSENFEAHAEELVKQIRKRNPKFGVIPKVKKTKRKKAGDNKIERINTRKPRMFSE